MAYNIQALSFKTFEMFAVLAVAYLVIVWTLSALIRLVESRLALPEPSLMLPQWFHDTAEYILRVGLPNTLKLAAFAVIASLVIGIVLGTLITIRFGPLQAVIRFYIEVWRGLPILVTVLFIYWMATAQVGGFRFELSAFASAAIGLSLGEARRLRRRRAEPFSRSRGSSTRLRPPSASAGSADTRS